MNRLITRRFLCTLAAVSLTLFVSCATATPRRSPATENAAEVEAFFMSGIDAFNRHDLDGFLRQFADDIDMYTPTGWLRGKQEVSERFATTFAQFPQVRMEIEQLEGRGVGPGTVVISFRWRVFPMGTGPAYHGVGTGVYVRRNSNWVEVLEHETVTRVDPELQTPNR
jgi:uncharacterized protein (TIGR02246 family)